MLSQSMVYRRTKTGGATKSDTYWAENKSHHFSNVQDTHCLSQFTGEESPRRSHDRCKDWNGQKNVINMLKIF